MKQEGKGRETLSPCFGQDVLLLLPSEPLLLRKGIAENLSLEDPKGGFLTFLQRLSDFQSRFQTEIPGNL